VGELSEAAREVYRLITDFVQRVPGVAHTVVVSSDGLPLAISEGLAKEPADQLATVAAGLIGLSQSASRVFGGGAITQTIVEMERGVLMVRSIMIGSGMISSSMVGSGSDGASLAVLAAPDCDMGLIAKEVELIIERAGQT
jgi:uncharacterized protein